MEMVVTWLRRKAMSNDVLGGATIGLLKYVPTLRTTDIFWLSVIPFPFNFFQCNLRRKLYAFFYAVCVLPGFAREVSCTGHSLHQVDVSKSYEPSCMFNSRRSFRGL